MDDSGIIQDGFRFKSHILVRNGNLFSSLDDRILAQPTKRRLAVGIS